MSSKFLDKEGLEVLWGIIKEKDIAIQEEIKHVVNLGYYYYGEFYVDQAHLHKYVPYAYKLYIEVQTYKVYAYINNQYVVVGQMPGAADEEHAGIAKLYNRKGNHIDGAITQGFFTGAIDEKVGAEIQEELLILTR